LCWFCHTSTMPVPPSSSFSLIMCPALHSLFSSIHNLDGLLRIRVDNPPMLGRYHNIIGKSMTCVR
jgi:hypothetical protein